MAWKILTEADIADGVNGPVLAAARTAALKAAQPDPLPTELARVTREVRGRVAAWSKNTLGPAGTIPDEAETSAIDIVVYRLCKRVGSALLKTEIADAKKMADAFLVDLSRGDVAIEQPEIPSGEIVTSPPSPRWKARRPQFKRCQQDGA
ncbi:MAG: hypothetical protein WC661_21340 [Opitutaceae bacterium]|jgi:hypothetical protein